MPSISVYKNIVFFEKKNGGTKTPSDCKLLVIQNFLISKNFFRANFWKKFQIFIRQELTSINYDIWFKIPFSLYILRLFIFISWFDFIPIKRLWYFLTVMTIKNFFLAPIIIILTVNLKNFESFKFLRFFMVKKITN